MEKKVPGPGRTRFTGGFDTYNIIYISFGRENVENKKKK